MSKPRSDAQASGTPERYVRLIWSDDGKHRVEIRGIRRRNDVNRLLKALQRHCFACQVRGLPLDTAETQRPGQSEEAEFTPTAVGGE